MPPEHHPTSADVRAVRRKRLRLAVSGGLTSIAIVLLHLGGVLPPG